MVDLIEGPGYIEPQTGKVAFAYAHPIFWAPFSLIGEGGRTVTTSIESSQGN